MTWPGPPTDRGASGSEQAPPWRPVPESSGDGGAGTSRTGPPRRGGASPQARPDRAPRKRGPLPLVAAGVGVVALGVAGWLAVSQGLVPGLGQPASADRDVLPDVTDEPEELWTYSYLPRSGEVTGRDLLASENAVFSLVGPEDGMVEDEGYTLTAVDLDDGTERWATGLDLGAHDLDDYVGASVLGVVDDTVVTRTTSSVFRDGDHTSVNTYLFIDVADGATMRTVETDENYQVVGDPGMLIRTDEGVVSRVDPADPEGTILWDVVTEGTVDYLSQAGSYLWINDPVDGQIVVEADTGSEPEWFDVPSPEATYAVDGDTVLRLESTVRGDYLDRLDDDGGVVWSADADQFFVRTDPSGDLVVFTGEKQSEDDSTYAYLQRLDLRTGEGMFDAEVEADFHDVGFVTRDLFVLSQWDSERSELRALGDGERTGRLRWPVSRTGSRTLYSLQEERLRAFDGEGTELWSVRARGAEGFLYGTDHLITRDSTSGRLTRWE